jgi:hypothetical protein
LTYRQAGELGACDRRTAINRFARTESYGFLRVEQRDYPYGGAAPNLVTAKIPSWVYEQVDGYRAMSPGLRPTDEPAAVARVSVGEAPPVASVEPTAVEPAAPTEAVSAPGTAAGSVTAAVASPSSTAAPAASDSAATPSSVLPTPSLAAPVLSPEDAAINARLEEIHALTRQRFEVTAIRGLNAQVPKVVEGAGVPGLDDEQILLALDEYLKKQRLKAKYPKCRERFRERAWVENGIHVFLWGKRQLLNGLVPKQTSRAKGRRPAAPRQTRASAPVNLAAVVAPVQLGATFEPDTTIVRAVRAGSIAASLLLQPGDKVVRVDDQAIAGPDDLRLVLSTMAPGMHTFELVRSNEVVTATLTLEPRGPPQA